MDRILKHLLDDFLASFERKPTSPDQDFELFANYAIIAHEYNRGFEIETVSIGQGNDTGIDGIAIIVNGLIVENIEEVDDMLANNGTLDVKFIFVQTKNSNGFDSSEMNNFAFGVKDFFAENPRLVRSEEIQAFATLADYIFKQARHFRENPQCSLYYVTTGTWADDQNNKAIIETAKVDLTQTNLFSQVSFFPMDAGAIAKYYRDTKNSTSTTFTFNEKVTLPELPQISEAYYGLVPLSEFRKLLFDDKGNLLNIFDDNVRDFQGLNNPINKTIETTLIGDIPELFTVLNNGVTIVANDLKASGNKFTIIDYQIVNGCQTSNVLSQHTSKPELQDLRIPVRLIVTNNDEVKNRITIATNSQTAIKREQLQAMKDFQKNLEHFYNTIQGDGRIYYERRTKQYHTDGSVTKSRVITVQNQIKAFGSMFVDIPHRVTAYFGLVLKQNVEGEKPTIFHPAHKYLPYYTAGLAYYRLDSLFRAREIDTSYRKVKWFLIMLFGKIANPTYPHGFDNKMLNSEKNTEAYCDPIIKILLDREQSIAIFEKTVEIFQKSGVNLNDKQGLKGAGATEQLLRTLDPKFYKNKPSS